ncbi:MAG: tetratricopeptide repeat protein, partial [Fimbriimonadales bacterium]|nr:tetratricopeptide repeat protein [Fimbriimonadales bacterium]
MRVEEVLQVAELIVWQGRLHEIQGQLDVAREHYEQALALLLMTCATLEAQGRAIPTELRLLVATCLNNIGVVYQAQGELAQASAYFQRALAIIEQVAPNSQSHAICLNNIGVVYKAQGELERAIEYLEQAVQVIESLRARAGSARAKEQLFAQHQSPYQSLIACLYEHNLPDDHARAFHYAERSRARTLLELLAERHINIRAETEQQQRLLEQERVLQRRLAATHNRLMELRMKPQASPELRAQLEAEELRLEEQLERLRDDIRRAFPEYAQIE